MDLSPTGRLVVRAGLVVLILGLLFLNVLILLSILAFFLLLLCQIILFRQRVNVMKRSVKIGKLPEHVEGVAGNEIAIDITICNESDLGFRILRFAPDTPSLSLQERQHNEHLSLPSHSEQRIIPLLMPNNPGRFELPGWIAIIEDRGRLFTQKVSLDGEITVLVHPPANKVTSQIDTGVMYDVAVDKLRRGRGTDLIGIRPLNFLDDFHRIDWKATARRGQLMARDFYLEKDPPVILVLDTSIKGASHEATRASRTLNEIAVLLFSFRPSVATGLILCDEQKVVLTIDPAIGQTTRKQILRELLEVNDMHRMPSRSIGRRNRSHADIARDTVALKEARNLPGDTSVHWNRLGMFSDFILPFYERSLSKFPKRISSQGVFHAFELICSLPSPAVVISITDGKTNFEGLSEGAKRAAMMNHKVIVANFNHHGADKATEVFLELGRHGVRILKIDFDGALWKAVASEILTMSHARIVESRLIP